MQQEPNGFKPEGRPTENARNCQDDRCEIHGLRERSCGEEGSFCILDELGRTVRDVPSENLMDSLWPTLLGES